FDVILGMNWLAQHYATLDCREKRVMFRIPGDDEFYFQGDTSITSPVLISVIFAQRMLCRRCQGYLALVRDTSIKTVAIEHIPIVNEFMDVFPKELPRLSPDREIEFCIDMVLGTASISMPQYRMALAELRELKEQLQNLLDKEFIW